MESQEKHYKSEYESLEGYIGKFNKLERRMVRENTEKLIKILKVLYGEDLSNDYILHLNVGKSVSWKDIMEDGGKILLRYFIWKKNYEKELLKLSPYIHIRRFRKKLFWGTAIIIGGIYWEGKRIKRYLKYFEKQNPLVINNSLIFCLEQVDSSDENMKRMYVMTRSILLRFAALDPNEPMSTNNLNLPLSLDMKLYNGKLPEDKIKRYTLKELYLSLAEYEVKVKISLARTRRKVSINSAEDRISHYEYKFKEYEKRNYLSDLERRYKEIQNKDRVGNRKIRSFIEKCKFVSEKYYFGNSDLNKLEKCGGNTQANKSELEDIFPIWLKELKDFVEWKRELFTRAKEYYKHKNRGYMAKLWRNEEDIRILLMLGDSKDTPELYLEYLELLKTYIRINYGLIKVLYKPKEIDNVWIKEFMYLVYGILENSKIPSYNGFLCHHEDLKEARKGIKNIIEDIRQEIISGKMFCRIDSSDWNFENYSSLMEYLVKTYRGMKFETRKIDISDRADYSWDKNSDRRKQYNASFNNVPKEEMIKREAIAIAELIEEFDMLSYEELAKIMKMSLSTFKRRVEKAQEMEI